MRYIWVAYVEYEGIYIPESRHPLVIYGTSEQAQAAGDSAVESYEEVQVVPVLVP